MRRGKEDALGRDLAVGKKNPRGKTSSPAVATCRQLGHGGALRAGRSRWEREELTKQMRISGLYAPVAGSPDALYMAPDASGDHQTKTERLF